LVAAAPSCNEPETVNSSVLRTASTAAAPLPARQLPATKSTVTSPAMNVSETSTPALGVSR
jgi:hypothetical protein